MKKDEIRAELLGLGEREREGFLVGWYLGGKEDGGGFAPTWLEHGGHRDLLPVRSNGCRYRQILAVFHRTLQGDASHPGTIQMSAAR
jgi:hypothetical protein